MKSKNLLCSIIAVFAVFFLALAHASALSNEVVVSDAWVQAMPPSQTTTAAYMVITNNAAKEAVLVSASSDIAQTTEIHQMSEMNGMMNMAKVPSIQIPALGKVALKPGGFHIMLINLKKTLNKGDRVAITLHFQNETDVVVNAKVQMQPENDPSGMAGMNK
jgi:copper(I)-binding protein